VKLANPLDGTVPYLRTSLLPGLIEIAKRNLSRGLVDLALYEIGTVFLPAPDGTFGSLALPPGAALPPDDVLTGLNAGIPAQPQHVAGLVLGNAIEKQPGLPAVPAGIADALSMVAQVGASVGLAIEPVQGSHQALHPGRTAELVVRRSQGDVRIGFAGELFPALAEEADLPRVVGVFELDLDVLFQLAPNELVAEAIAVFPAATQDLSLVVGAEVAAGDVERAVVEGAGELLEHARLVDDYRGTGIPEGTKSLTFALRFRAGDRTLTAAEASEAKLAGAARAGELFGAHIRD
jgi:phenylalanyl-tRNA synthetase beta chain